MFYVIDNYTKTRIACYATRKRAQRRADKLNLEYGAHRYIVVSI